MIRTDLLLPRTRIPIACTGVVVLSAATGIDVLGTTAIMCLGRH